MHLLPSHHKSARLHVTLLLLAAGFCCEVRAEPADGDPPLMEAAHTDGPIELDGQLNEPAWEQTRVYSLQLAADQAPQGKTLGEQGQVRLLWDADHLYVGIAWEDHDLLARGTRDHQMHFRLGDLCELFLKHEGHQQYWELYGTPAQKKSCFWFERRGTRIQTDKEFGLRVATHLDGTLNDSSDRDSGWSAELAVSSKDLTRTGTKFGPGSSWRILVARYNYSTERGRRRPELSMTPQLSRNSYHLLEEHARLEFLPAKNSAESQ